MSRELGENLLAGHIPTGPLSVQVTDSVLSPSMGNERIACQVHGCGPLDWVTIRVGIWPLGADSVWWDHLALK